MAIPNQVRSGLGAGVLGELYGLGTPVTAQALVIDSTGTANPNRVGRAFTYTSNVDGHCSVGGTPGGNTAFAGILADPKLYALTGVPGNTLGASLDLPQGAVGTFVQHCPSGLWVNFEAAGRVGWPVAMDNTTGQLWPYDPATTPAAGRTTIPNARVDVFNLAAAGLGVITLNK